MMHGGATRDDATRSATGTPTKRHGRQVQDINHLLGFTLPPRAPPPPAAPRRSAKRNHGHGAFDRARFVHQYRFVVRPDKDYTAHFADPDIRLDWASDILQVILPTSASALSSVALSTVDQPVEDGTRGIPTCPICLSEPTAARMTKCGHVFCYPCILHYLALADGTKWRKCPVCWDSIYAKDLKAVKWHDPVIAAAAVEMPPNAETPSSEIQDEVRPTETIKFPRETLKMRLIRRPQITTLALPRSPTWPSEAVPPLRAPWQFTPDAATYAKFMLAPPDYLKEELEGNLRELKKEVLNLKRWGMAGSTDEELGIVFVQTAVRKVEEQLQKVEALKTSSVMTARKKALRELQEVRDAAGRAASHLTLPLASETSSSEIEAETDGNANVPTEFLGSRRQSELSGTAPSFVPGSGPPPKARPQRRNVNPHPPDPDSSYYYYQAASGQNIFLHPLDIKILKAHFGSYEGMPDSIEVVVEGADEGTVTEDLRKRCRWLSHLPTACDVVFVEADLGRVVPKSALEPFASALKQRRTKRKDKARREDRAKTRAEQKEAESLPILYRSSEYSPPSRSLPLPTAFASIPSSFDEPHAFPPPSSEGGMSASPPSVAQQPPVEPTDGPRTVWGTRSFASTLNASSRPNDYSAWDDDYDERWHDFEERITGGGTPGRGAGQRGGGSASGSNSGGGRGQQDNSAASTGAGSGQQGGGGGGGFKGKKKGKKLTLNLTGSAMRGAR